MNKEQIIELIRATEAELLQQAIEMRQAFGPNDKAALNTQARWGAISDLLETIEQHENN